MNYMFLLASHSILDASKGFDPGQFIQSILSIVCLLIDSVVYYITSLAFKLYLAISQFELFNTSTFNDIIDRTYVVIGVISIFLVAYALLNAIINPDNFSKGDKSITKIVKNLIIAIIGIAVVPTIFNYFYYFQKVVLCNNTIPKLLLKRVDDDGSTMENTAKEFSALLFESFFYPNAASGVGDEAVDLSTAAEEVKLKSKNPYNDLSDGYTLADAYKNAESGKSFFITFLPFIFGDWGKNGIIDNSVQYLVILSTVAGGYMAYVMISLCIDMGRRAVKLAYLELIAPLAIITTIVPGKDSVFKNWIKKTTSCALEVFTRLFVVVFAVYLVNTIKDINLISWFSTTCGIRLGPVTSSLARSLILSSIFAFVKQAPKFFSEATGIKSDGFKIGIMDKLKENGMLQGLGAAGGGITAGVRNMAPGVAKGFATGGVLGAIGGGIKSLPSGLAGAASGTRRGWNKAKEAKKWSDVRTAAGDAADEAMEAKLKRQDYREAHGGTTTGAISGHIKDAWDKVKDYPSSHRANYAHEKAKQEEISKITAAQKAIDDKYAAIIDKNKDKILYRDKTISAWEQKEATAKSYLDGLSKKKAELVANGASQQDIDNIDVKINAAQDEAIKAHSDVVKATRETKKQMHKDITKIEIDEIDPTTGQRKIFAPKAEDNAVIAQLYADYNSMLKSHVDALSGDQALYKTAQAVLSEVSKQPTEDAQKAMFRQIIENKFDVNGQSYNFDIDDVKVEAARVTEKMNQEGEAARKQQEGKK